MSKKYDETRKEALQFAAQKNKEVVKHIRAVTKNEIKLKANLLLAQMIIIKQAEFLDRFLCDIDVVQFLEDSGIPKNEQALFDDNGASC